MPASQAFAVSKKGGKRNKRRKTSDDNDKRSPRPSNPDIQCWYFARKGHTRNNCNFKKAADNSEKRKTRKSPPPRLPPLRTSLLTTPMS